MTTSVPPGRRRSTRLGHAASLLVALAVVVGLSACDPDEPTPPPPPASASGSATPSPSATPTPSPSPSPTSEKDREQAAIKQAVLDFRKTMNRIRKDPKADISALKKVAGGELLELELSTMKQWRAKGWRQTGDVRVEKLEIGAVSSAGTERSVKTTYCANSTGVDALDPNGESVVVEDRPDYFPTVMELKKADGNWIAVREYIGGDACPQE